MLCDIMYLTMECKQTQNITILKIVKLN